MADDARLERLLEGMTRVETKLDAATDRLMDHEGRLRVMEQRPQVADPGPRIKELEDDVAALTARPVPMSLRQGILAAGGMAAAISAIVLLAEHLHII